MLQTLCTTKRVGSTFGRKIDFEKKHGNDTRSPLLVNDTDSKLAKGSPRDTVKSKAFFKVKEVLVENDKEQFTISDLVGRM